MIKFNKVKLLSFLESIKKSRFFLISSVLLVLSLVLFLFKSLFVAALVNGRPVSRLSLIKELEKQQGKEVLSGLIDRTLINEEARKSGIKVSQEDVDSEIKNIETELEKQDTTLDKALADRGQAKDQLVDQIRMQKTVVAILGQKIEIKEEDIKSYYDKNKDLFDKDAKYEDIKPTVKDQIFQQRLSSEYFKWIQDLRQKAKINYFVNL